MVVGGALALVLLVVNVALLLEGPSRVARMRAADQHGVSAAQYHDAWSAALDVQGSVTAMDDAGRSYLRSVPLDQGAQLVNGADWLSQLDADVARITDSPSLQNPEVRSAYDAFTAELEGYRESRQTLVGAADQAAPVLALCNPYALPVHTPRDPANAEVLQDCIDQLGGLRGTGDPTVAEMGAAADYLETWVTALDPSTDGADRARDEYIAAVDDAAVAGEARLEESRTPLETALDELTVALESRSEPPR